MRRRSAWWITTGTVSTSLRNFDIAPFDFDAVEDPAQEIIRHAGRRGSKVLLRPD